MAANTTTADAITTEAYRRSGKRIVSDDALKRGREQWLQEIVDEVIDFANLTGDAGMEVLQMEKTTALSVNDSNYTIPNGADEYREIYLVEFSDINLNAVDNIVTTQVNIVEADVDAITNGILGKYLYVPTGAGNGQIRQVLSRSTSTLTITEAWTTQPTNAANDPISYVTNKTLLTRETASEIRNGMIGTTPGKPTAYAIYQGEIRLDRPPDKTYGLWQYFYANPLKLALEDSADVLEPVWTRIMDEWRSVLMAGMRLKLAEEMDDAGQRQIEARYKAIMAGLFSRDSDAEAFDHFELRE